MDKRHKPLAAQDQLRLRRQRYEEIARHPEWTAPGARVRPDLRTAIPGDAGG